MFTLRAACGVIVRLTDLGATLMRIAAPDKHGQVADVLLGHDRPGDYPAAGAPGDDAYLGATCGRYGNRIAGAAFVLDGTRHALTANDGRNQNHGGTRGFHQALWQVAHADARRVTLRHHSPDRDQGFPGALDATADYALSDEGELAIVYTAITTRPTHVNLVSHGYFNLSGVPGSTILDHRLHIPAAEVLEIDAEAIPTGVRRAVAGTAFDFAAPRAIGERIDDTDDPQLRLGDGYNHNFVLPGAGLRPAAALVHPASGRRLTLATDQPGLQLYTGNALGGPFPRRGGVCLEAQAWPDSPNRADFPSTRLDPGALYRSETRLRFDVAA